MELQVSHRHASSSSGGIHALAMKKPPKLLEHPLPNSACLQRDLMTMSFPDLLKVAKQLKHAGVITTLRLFVSLNEQHIVNQRFSSLDHRTTDAACEFTRALSRAIEGWMHDVEIGLSLWNRDLKVLSEAFGFSKTLRRLSFANSGLGDVRLEILAGGLRDCMPLQNLDLSGCALTDASARCITVIVKHNSEVPVSLHVPGNQPLMLQRSGLSFLLFAYISHLHDGTRGQDLWASSLSTEPLDSLIIQARTSKSCRQYLVHKGLWSPIVHSPESAGTRKAELEWKASLREPMGRESGQDSCLANKIPVRNLALAALDLSYNAFTDVLPRDLCVALRMGAPLYALNLRFNQMTRVGAKLLLDVMHEFNILRLVDLRGNEDEKLLGVLENGEHYTQFSTFQAPFWLDSPNYITPDRMKKRDSEAKHPDQRPFQIGKCSLALQSPTPTALLRGESRSPFPSEDQSPPKFSASEAAAVDSSDEGTGASSTLRLQRPPKKGRPQTSGSERRIMPVLYLQQKRSCDQENSRPRLHAWDRDWVRKHMTPPGMIDPPREAVSAEPPKMFTNELYEIEEQKPTPSESTVCLTSMSSKKEVGQIVNFGASLQRCTPRRSSTERANNKRNNNSQRRRSRRPSRTSRKSPPPNQIARAKYLPWDVRNQKKTKPSVCEEQLTSSEDIKKEVEWHKFVTEMTETLLTLRDGLDKLIGPTEDDVDVLSVAPRDANSKNLSLGPAMFQH